MKKISAFICVHLWLIFLCFSISAQDFKTIQDGIEYAETTRESDNTTIKINLLRLDLTKVRLDVVHAMDAAIGTELTSSMAKRYGAIAAINAGFFRLDKSIFAGDAAGVLQIDGKLLSESHNGRIAILILNTKDKTEIKFSHLDVRYMVVLGKTIIETDGVNRERKDNETVLYTPEFNRTTLTNGNGIEVIIKNKKVIGISKNSSSLIPADGFVLSLSGAKQSEIKRVKIGDNFAFNELTPSVYYDNEEEQEAYLKKIEPLSPLDDRFFRKTEDITNGVPQLIKNGKIEITWEQEKSSKEFVETRHPRTAVAKLKDGKFLMITVDGRSEQSGGIGLEDLAKLLLEFGATDAMNLDGGGSTTMFLDGKVVNHPSDKEGERKVGDAILVFPRKNVKK